MSEKGKNVRGHSCEKRTLEHHMWQVLEKAQSSISIDSNEPNKSIIIQHMYFFKCKRFLKNYRTYVYNNDFIIYSTLNSQVSIISNTSNFFTADETQKVLTYYLRQKYFLRGIISLYSKTYALNKFSQFHEKKLNKVPKQ